MLAYFIFLAMFFFTAHHEHYNTPFVPRLCFLISTSSIPYIMTTHTKQNDNQKNREKEKKKNSDGKTQTRDRQRDLDLGDKRNRKKDIVAIPVKEREREKKAWFVFFIRMEMGGTGWLMGSCANRDGFVWFPSGWDIRIICVTILLFLREFSEGVFKFPYRGNLGK